jgi:ArsR family transcriptional regulator
MPEKQQMKSPSPDFDAAMRAIAHPLRREILKWLKTPLVYFPQQDWEVEWGVSVGQITQRCGLSQSTVSQHLAVLKQVTLVDIRKEGPFHFFKRNEATLGHLTARLRDQLGSSGMQG